MASLATSSFSLPKHLASGIWSKATTGSTVAALSGSEPMLFGETQLMTFTQQPKAQYVAEGATKSATDPAFGTKTVTPRKAQVTMRFNEEVQWADEDYQLGVLGTLSDATSGALARALDLGIYHAINPLTGVALSGSPAKVLDTGNNVELTTATLTTADTVLETAAGLVIADGFTPNAIALDPGYAWTIATARYSDGRKKYPDLGLGINVTNFEACARRCRPPSPPRRPRWSVARTRRPTRTSRRSWVTSPRSGGVCSGASAWRRSSTATRTARVT